MSIISHAFIDAVHLRPSRPRRTTLIAMLIIWRHRHRTREQLRRLDRRELMDVGIDPVAQKREIARWFWQP
jgi:uncharacterized protein YjiS (DUF1127 family)